MQAAFKDIKIDLTNGNLLTEEEIANKTLTSFGVIIGDDGTPTRVDAADANANIVLEGKYHSNEHGWGNFKSTVKVDGPVKISMGTCAWGGDVTVKTASGETVATFSTNTGVCYHNNKAENIASAYYKGTEATTLTISGGSYTPYIAVEAADPSELKEEYTVTFGLGEYATAGVAPAETKVESGKTLVIPANRTMYVEGKTLTGWTDGTDTYAIGTEYAPTASTTLTPVFADNKVSLKDPRKEAVAITWDFQRKNGAPTVGWEGGATPYAWVAQATIGTETIDVKMDVDVSAGKLANANWTDWAQMNSGTKLTIPAAATLSISLECYEATTATTFDGSTDYEASGNVVTYQYAGDAETIDIVIGNGSYFRYVKAVYPAIKSDKIDEDVSVTWKNEDGVNNPSAGVESNPDAFSMAEYGCTYPADMIGTGAFNGLTVTSYKSDGTTGCVTFTLKPSLGINFTPASIETNMLRFGTDGGTVDIAYKIDEQEEKVVATGIIPMRNKEGEKYEGTSVNYTIQNLTGVEVKSGQTITFKLYIKGQGAGKSAGFSNIVVKGHAAGTLVPVNKYTLATNVTPEGAGSVTAKPKSAEYDENTEITLTANRNFGYKFVNWTDAEGKEVASTEEYKFNIAANTTLTANFEVIPTYELKYNVTGGANLYMVTPAPQPTVVDGKNMYEEGTTVSLSASSNKIMTFTNWSNGETAGEISLTMNQDQDITANYSASDFIAAWDFIVPGCDGRTADFAAADNDAAALVMRTETGETSAWLDKSLQAAGGYEGRNAAVNWRTTGLGNYYWQTTVNAEAFTDIKVASAMAYNYNAYTKYNCQVSTNGTDWETIGTFSIEGSKKWTDNEFSLPASANNQKEVHIRWIADKTSSIDGTTSSNDGIAISDIFITGTMKLVDDGKAPKLMATVPEEGNANASANGKIILTFDEKVKVAENATATIGTAELTPAVSGKTVIFEYKGLEYSTAYTFTLPANSVSDLTGNAIESPITINFSTKTRPAVAKGSYDFVVPDDGDFKAAIAAADKRDDMSKRFRIFIKQGAYTIPASETEKITGSDGVAYPSPITNISTPNISIIGEGMEVTSIVNTLPDVEINGDYGPANPIEGLHKCQTLNLTKNATATYFEDITIKNGMKDSRGRNAALEDQSNKTICKDVCLHGYQDTYLSNNDKGRFYFEGGRLRGRTDFLCGKGDVYYYGVDLMMCEGGYVCAPSNPKQYGYVFKNCTIKGEKDGLDGNFTLGRPWGKGTPTALFIDTKMEIQPSAVGWNEMSGGWPARFAEYNSTTASGTEINLSNRKRTFGDGHENNPILSASEAAQLTIGNVMGADDDWDPTAATEQASAPKNVKISGTTITWDNSNYVLLWAVCKDGKVIGFTNEPAYTVTDTNAKYSVRAANEMGGLGEATEAAIASEISNVGNPAEVVSTSFYNLNGNKVSKSYKGAVIMVETLADGTTVTTKVMK